MASNSLVVAAKGPSPVAGLGLVGDINNLTKDHDPWDYTIDGVSTALDTIGTVLDPFGAIAGAGIGWLLQHVDFLREPLDKLTGDAAAITGMTSTWENVADRLHQSAEAYQTAVKSTEHWSGEAAEHYRAAAQDLIAALWAVGDHAQHAAEGMTAAGVIVGTERAIIYDLISGFVGRAIVEGLAALAASWFTFGGSIAVFVAAVDIDAAIQYEEASLKVGALMRRIAAIAHKFDAMSSRAKVLANDLHRAGGGIRMKAGGQKGLKTIGKNRFVKGDHGAAVNHLVDASTALRNGPLGTLNKTVGELPANLVRSSVGAADRHHKAEEQRNP